MELPPCMACAIPVEEGLDQRAAGLHFALGIPSGHPSGGSNEAGPRQVSAPRADDGRNT